MQKNSLSTYSRPYHRRGDTLTISLKIDMKSGVRTLFILTPEAFTEQPMNELVALSWADSEMVCSEALIGPCVGCWYSFL